MCRPQQNRIILQDSHTFSMSKPHLVGLEPSHVRKWHTAARHDPHTGPRMAGK
jgi:hypothetical protein